MKFQEVGSMWTQSKFIAPGDIKALVNWLDDPKNHSGAVDAVTFAPENRKDDAFIDFIALSKEFQGWDRETISNAVSKANELDLMERRKMTKNNEEIKLETLVLESIVRGLQEALKERKEANKPVVAKISKEQLAEVVRKAVRQAIKDGKKKS